MKNNNFIFIITSLLLILPLITEAFIFRPFFDLLGKPLTFEKGIFLPACEQSCSLSASPTSGSAPLTVTFNVSPNSSNCSVSWNGPCTFNNFSCNYTYQNPGNYGPYRATVVCRVAGESFTYECSSRSITVTGGSSPPTSTPTSTPPPPPPPPPPPTCNPSCGNWSITGNCGTGGCPPTHRPAVRTCIRQDCSTYQENTCLPDPNNCFDVAVTKLDIRSFICKNNTPDISYISDYLSRNPNYQYPPSTTAATDYMNINQIEGKTILQCPETQRNRPVEFSAKGECNFGNCPSSKLRIFIKPEDISASPYETKSIESQFNSSYPKEVKEEYIFQNAYNYSVTACLVNNNNNPITDVNPSNNCRQFSLKVYDYYCRLGFCVQTQRDWRNHPLYEKTIQVLGKNDAPCRFWRNQICRARFGF